MYYCDLFTHSTAKKYVYMMVINYLLGIVREGQFKWLIGHVRELHGVVKKEKKRHLAIAQGLNSYII